MTKPKSTRTTRRAKHMERFTEIVRVRTRPGQYILRLKIEQQSFQVGYENPAPKTEVLWMRDMLCNALDKMVKLAAVKP